MILGKNVGSVFSEGREIKKVYSLGKLVWEKTTVEPVIDYSREYFTVRAIRDGVKVSLRNRNNAIIKYSINEGSWQQTVGSVSSVGVQIVELNENDTVRISTTDTINCFVEGNRSEVYGNIMSLMYGDNYIGQNVWTDTKTSYTETNRMGFFGGTVDGTYVGSSFEDASNLILPATSLNIGAYAYMFANCRVLRYPPQILATTLAEGCYAYMFAHCYDLRTPPQLPATTLAYRCYYYMFYNSYLTTAPELPATTLAEGCYESMFRKSSINNELKLPATTLSKNCYKNMFYECINLFTAPELPASTLVEGCYVNMFKYCRRLEYVKCYATRSATYLSDCVNDWLYYAGDYYDGDGNADRVGTLECYESYANSLTQYIPDWWKVKYIV